MHLAPVFVISGPQGGLSLFNLVPLTVAESADQLMRLAATPFHLLRFFGRDFAEKGVTYPIEVWFVTDKGGIGRAPNLNARPVVVWIEDVNDINIVRYILGHG